MALQRFTKPGNSTAEEKVAIWTKGQVGLNRVLVEKRGLKEYNRVILFFDPDVQQMVFQFTNDKSAEGAVSVSYSNNNVGLMSAKPFLDFFNVDHSVSRKYPAHFDTTNKTLTLAVSEGIVTVSKKRTKKVVPETVPEQPSVQPNVQPNIQPTIEPTVQPSVAPVPPIAPIAPVVPAAAPVQPVA